MTKDEALKILKGCRENGFKYTFYTLGDYHTALDMAIKALGRESCEDAISRQAAIEAVIDLCKYYTPTKSVNHPHMDFVIEALQDLPSVNQDHDVGVQGD